MIENLGFISGFSVVPWISLQARMVLVDRGGWQLWWLSQLWLKTKLGFALLPKLMQHKILQRNLQARQDRIK